ncbi:MAG: lysophospholipid acyltransferase family protein [Bacillota bacterium]
MFYRFAWFFFLLLLRVFNRLEVIGKENIPLSGQLIVACNHISVLDPIVVGVSLPRPVRFMAKKELFEHPLLKWPVKALGAFPVDRSKNDVQAVKWAFKILANQEVLGIFPEGTRRKSDSISFRSGTAGIALRARCRILPVGLIGTDRILKGRIFSKVRLAIGAPIDWPAGYQGKPREEDILKLTIELQNAVENLIKSLNSA